MKQPEPIHHPLCARLSASGEFVFPDTACNCGGYRSLEDYLRADYARGIVGHELRVSLADDDRVLFYVHPMNVDGDTMDFEVRRNRLTPNPRVGRIGVTHPLEGEASKEPTPSGSGNPFTDPTQMALWEAVQAALSQAQHWEPDPIIRAEIQTLRDQALDPKRQLRVDRGTGVVAESLVERRLILAVCEMVHHGLTREQIEARLATCSSNMLRGNWQAIVVGLLFDDHADAPHVRAQRVRCE